MDATQPTKNWKISTQPNTWVNPVNPTHWQLVGHRGRGNLQHFNRKINVHESVCKIHGSEHPELCKIPLARGSQFGTLAVELIHYVPEIRPAAYFLTTLSQKLTDFNYLWYPKSRENLAPTAYIYANLTCQMYPLYLMSFLFKTGKTILGHCRPISRSPKLLAGATGARWPLTFTVESDRPVSGCS